MTKTAMTPEERARKKKDARYDMEKCQGGCGRQGFYKFGRCNECSKSKCRNCGKEYRGSVGVERFSTCANCRDRVKRARKKNLGLFDE